MGQYQVTIKQTWFDIALLTTGSIESVYALAENNNAQVTDTFTGEQLKSGVKKTDVINLPVLNYIATQSTAMTNSENYVFTNEFTINYQ